MPAYLVAAVYPERVAGVVSLGIPFMLPGPTAVQNHLLPEGFYVSRWQVYIKHLFDHFLHRQRFDPLLISHDKMIYT